MIGKSVVCIAGCEPPRLQSRRRTEDFEEEEEREREQLNIRMSPTLTRVPRDLGVLRPG